MTDDAVKQRKRRWREDNPEKARASVERFYERNPLARRDAHLRQKYGIGLHDVVSIASEQGGCGICGSQATGQIGKGNKPAFWVVDHCHKTGKIRGVLCHPCNKLLGMAKDNPQVLRFAADYLEKSNGS